MTTPRDEHDPRRDGLDADLQREIERMEREMVPEHDLWPGIEARLTARSEPWWRRAGALLTPTPARLALVAALLVLALGLSLIGRGSGPAVVDAPVVASVASVSSEVLVLTAHREDGALQVHRDLVNSLESSRGEIAPEILVAVESTLGVLNEAIGEVRLALAQDPANGRLNHLLASYYQKEVDVLRKLSRI